MKEGFYAAAVLTASVALSGCGGSSSSDSSSTDGATGSAGGNTVVLPAEFRGTWRQPCHEEDGEYVSAIFNFSESQLVRDERYFEDVDCTVAVDRFYQIATTYSLVVYNQTVITSYGAAYAIDFTSTAAEVDGSPFASFFSTTEYDLILVQGDSFLVGYDDGSNPNSGESAADRPTEIDPDPLMIR